jgi:hypothetical protein
MDDPPLPIARHEAVDRFGKVTLRSAHRLSAALAEGGDAGGEEPIIVRTDGPHRTIDGLAALIDAVLADDAHPGEACDRRAEGAGGSASPTG